MIGPKRTPRSILEEARRERERLREAHRWAIEVSERVSVQTAFSGTLVPPMIPETVAMDKVRLGMEADRG